MSEHQDEPERKPRLNLTTSQVAASALAACCSSVVASYLGVAGTVIGAAVGSIVATTGAAVYGHLFRRGGDKIKQTLLVNGQQVEVELDPRAAADAAFAAKATQAAHAADAAKTRAIGADGAATQRLWRPASADERDDAGGKQRTVDGPVPRPRDGGLGRIRRYRRPIGVAAAIAAVFCVSIAVGFLLGGPARDAGTAPPPHSGTTTTSTRDTSGAGDGRGRQTSDPSSSPTATPPTGPSTPPSPSAGSATPTPTPSAAQSSAGSPSPAAGTAAAGTGTAHAQAGGVIRSSTSTP